MTILGCSHSRIKEGVVRVKQEYNTSSNPWQYEEQPQHNPILPQGYLLYHHGHHDSEYQSQARQHSFDTFITATQSSSCKTQSYHASPQPFSQYSHSPMSVRLNGGTTFGNLVGVDMSQSLEAELEMYAAPNEDEKKTSSISKGKSPRRLSRVKRELEENDGWEPPLWRQQLQNIIKMREARDAPVDLMGAHKNAEQTTHVTPKVSRSCIIL